MCGVKRISVVAMWNAASLFQPILPGTGPSTEDTRGIVDELYEEWCPEELTPPNEIHMWAAQRFETEMDNITQDTLKQAVTKRVVQFKKLFELVKINPELREDCMVTERIERMAKVMRECRNSVQSAAILLYQLDDARQLSIPDQWNPDNFFKYIEEDEKATTFQRLLMIVCRKLAIDRLRKLDDKCYVQVALENDEGPSHAWKEKCSIRDYIYEQIQKETDYEEWKCLTNPHDNCDKVVNHLVNTNQIEFPPLVMNRYLWAYKNGLYNVEQDTFWPFYPQRFHSLLDITAERVVALPEHVPGEHDDDIARSPDWVSEDGVEVWNIKDDKLTLQRKSFFRVAGRLYLNFCGREHWAELGRRITAFRNGVHFMHSSDVKRSEIKGRIPVCGVTGRQPPDAQKAVTKNGVQIWNDERGDELGLDTMFAVDGVYYSNAQRWFHFRTVETLQRDRIQARLKQAKVQPVTPADATVHGVDVWKNSPCSQLGADTIFGLDGKFYSNEKPAELWTPAEADKPFVVQMPTNDDVAVKYFDVDFRFSIIPETEMFFDAGEIELEEMGTIMDAQQLEQDTKDWLVVMLCRLFFPTGYDRWQVVLFIKGIAGSGKSTLAQIIRSFYPPALISTLSSNIEPKFGLSAIYKGLVCICAEVRDNFGLDQAEWQSCVSGEEVQIAVKQKTAFQHKWETPFFFLGNEMPGYKNASGSVDRRIFMIEFQYRVQKSDPHLFNKFMRNIDLFQRKGVSMYHRKLRQNRDKDIWCEDVVGKQLLKWKQRVKEQSDCLYAFVTSDVFVIHTELSMPMVDFKEMYMEYRRANGYDKTQWKPQHYETVFQDQGLSTTDCKKTYRGVTKTQKYITGLDVRPDEDAMIDE